MAPRSTTAPGSSDAAARSRFERRSAVLAIALLLVGIPFGLLLHQVAVDGPFTGLDERLARSWHDRLVHQHGLVAAMRAVSVLGSAAVLVPVVTAAVLWLAWAGHRRLAVFLATTSLGGAALSTGTKVVVGRPRPELDEPLATALGKSFPSGHSFSSLVCFGALLVVFLPFVPRRWRPATVVGTALLVVAIGASRLVLGVHFLSDVLGGYALGGAWLAGCVALFETWRHERGRRSTQPLAEGIEPEV